MRRNISLAGRVLGALAVVAGGTALGYHLSHRSTLPGEQVASADAPPLPAPGPSTGPKPVPRGEGGRAGAADDRTGRRALLVGCSKYDNLAQVWHLQGPPNDVALVKGLLVEKFGFAPGDIVCLTESEGTPERRPTRANIEREFRELAKAAREGDQVFILLAGHGSRQPQADPDNATYLEPDGIDEVFLPADVRKSDPFPARIPGGIVDDEISDWLKAITDKKAYVCAVFDCCHSGNIDRDKEVTRKIPDGVLVASASLEEARKRAAGRTPSGGAGTPAPEGWVPPGASNLLVTVSACRANETTPESAFPVGSRDAKYHGLLSYTLCEVLSQATTPLTYAELVHRTQVRYAGRPQGAPTPTVEGAGQNREVLGRKEWPGRSNILLRKTPTGYTVTAGDLHGLTSGSVLAVEGPPGSADSGKRLGYVRVGAIGRNEAAVAPVEYEKTPTPTGLPDLAVCRVVFTDYGARRIRLAVEADSDLTRQQLLQLISHLGDPKLDGPITLVEKAGEADWIIRMRDGDPELAEVSGNRPSFPAGKIVRAARDETAEALERVYRARNLLAVAARGDAAVANADSPIKVEIEVLTRKPGERKPTPAPKDSAGVPILKTGDPVSYRIHNRSPFKLDVTLLIVGTDYRISRFFPEPNEVAKASLDAQGTCDTPEGDVGPPYGPEQMVVIAVKSRLPQADFGSLAQSGLESRRGEDKSKSLETPLGQLLESAMYRSGGTRGVTRGVATEMGLRVISWRTEEKAQK